MWKNPINNEQSAELKQSRDFDGQRLYHDFTTKGLKNGLQEAAPAAGVVL
jgi:hypothetical protein